MYNLKTFKKLITIIWKENKKKKKIRDLIILFIFGSVTSVKQPNTLALICIVVNDNVSPGSTGLNSGISSNFLTSLVQLWACSPEGW